MSAQPAVEAPKSAQLSVVSQYVSELSFDNAAAKERKNPESTPQITVNVGVDASNAGEDRFRVSQRIEVTAATDTSKVFSVTLAYVGVFSLKNVPENAEQAVLLIECPRLLFPFARRIVADTTRDGGYPPLMLDPVDFAALYRQRAAEAAAASDTVN